MPGAASRRVAVTGATSLVGHFLLPRLLEGGFEVHALSRKGHPVAGAPAGATWHALDIAKGLGGWTVGEVPCLVHLAPLWLLPPLLDEWARRGVGRLIAFSSTSRFTKEVSGNRREWESAKSLAQAEEALAASCGTLGIAWTVFRPTLIYGGGLDRNVTAIARFIRRFGFFPVAGEGRGRRQPVHADDLAVACLSALDCPAAFGRAYHLTGGSTLTYVEMVKTVFRGMNRKPRILRLPLPLLRGLLACASLLPRYSHLSAEMADRMGEDLCFDSADAARDFGYAPRPFACTDQDA